MTLVERPTDPRIRQVKPDTAYSAGMTRAWVDRERALCEQVSDLHAAGVDYLEACRIVFDGPTLGTTPAARRVWVDRQVRREIRTMLARLPWLHVDEPAGVAS